MYPFWEETGLEKGPWILFNVSKFLLKIDSDVPSLLGSRLKTNLLPWTSQVTPKNRGLTEGGGLLEALDMFEQKESRVKTLKIWSEAKNRSDE